jgi:hypothetical protein
LAALAPVAERAALEELDRLAEPAVLEALAESEELAESVVVLGDSAVLLVDWAAASADWAVVLVDWVADSAAAITKISPVSAIADSMQACCADSRFFSEFGQQRSLRSNHR